VIWWKIGKEERYHELHWSHPARCEGRTAAAAGCSRLGHKMAGSNSQSSPRCSFVHDADSSWRWFSISAIYLVGPTQRSPLFCNAGVSSARESLSILNYLQSVYNFLRGVIEMSQKLSNHQTSHVRQSQVFWSKDFDNNNNNKMSQTFQSSTLTHTHIVICSIDYYSISCHLKCRRCLLQAR
jgi:hypothetical protein